MGRLTSLSAANGTGRTKTWDSSKGTLEAYEWTGTGSAPRSLTWDNRGNLASQTKDSYSGRYQYDGQNRLVYSDEGWPVETSTKGGANTNYGTRERDVGGRKSLDFGNPTATLKFDYAATSVGVNLGQIESVNKVRLGRTSPRVSARTLEVYVSKIGTAGTWTKVENTTLITDQSGTTIQLKAPEDAQFVKIHSAWDERNSDNESVDNSSVTGKPDDLIEVWSTVNGQATSYSYDGLGNRLSTTTNTAGTTSATYYPNTNTVKTNGIWEYNYDPNGNLISRGTEGSWDDSAKSYTWSATSGELWNYAYDLKNRLVEVKHSTAGSGGLRLVADYSYDMRDLRVVTTKPEGTTYYQYDTSGDLIWKSEAGNSTKYIQALGETWAEVRSTASGSATYYHHTDHEGSTELITDANGKVVWSGSYEAFGKLSRSNGGLEFDASYTGKQVDPDTGLYYFNARWYDPTLGRFITEDPARDGNNWYTYAAENPLTKIDPTGNEVIVASGEDMIDSDPFSKNGNWSPDATYLLQRSPFDKTMLAKALNFLGIRSNEPKVLGRLEYDKKGEYVDKEPNVGWDRIRIKDIKTGDDKGGFWGTAKKDGTVECLWKGAMFGFSVVGDALKFLGAGEALSGGAGAMKAGEALLPGKSDFLINPALAPEDTTVAGLALSFVPGAGTVTSGIDIVNSIMKQTEVKNEEKLEEVK